MAVNPNETAYQQKPTTDPATMTAAKTASKPDYSKIKWGAALDSAPTQQQTPAQQINNAMQTAEKQRPVSQTNQAATAPSQTPRQQITTAWQSAATPAPKQPSAQTQANAQTTQEATGNIYKVGSNGQGPKGMKVGDQVVTASGTYTVMGINPDGSYQSKLTNANQTTGNYTGQYANAPVAPTNVYRVGADGKAPTGLKVGDQVVTAGGTYQITGVNADGTYQSQLVNRDQTTANYTGAYANGQVTPEDLFRYQNGYVADNSIRTQNPYPGMEELNQQMYENQQQQAANQINYTTEQAVREQNRIYEDALPEFQKQRNQVDIDEARAKSNSALYAEARGDRGGIGQSQYNEIQAAAMQNRQAINTAQQKLATDIARKVADLRAQGEYQLSDAMLELGNQYLSRLMDLKAQGAEFALNIEQMNRELANQDRQFQLQVANITGEYNGQPTYAAQKYEQERYAAWVEAMAKAGMEISPELLKAAGLDGISGDISKYANLMAALSFSSGRSGGGGGSGRGSGGGGGGNGGSGLPEDPGNGGNGNENKPTLQNYMNNIAGRVSAIDRNKSLSYTQKAAKKAALVDQLYAWVDQGNISPADAGHIIEAYDLRGTTSAEREANTQNKRKVDKEGRGFE